MCSCAIVTGATSFIGIALIKKLLNEHYNVIAVIRPNSLGKGNIPLSNNVKIIEAQLSSLDQLELGDRRYETLFHIGWANDFVNSRYNFEEQMKNIEYTQKAVELAIRSGCNTFVGVGSQAECGRVDHKISSKTPDNPENAYAIAKCEAYYKSLKLCENYGLKHCWPRLLSAYGPYDRPHTLIMSCLEACLQNKKIELTACEQIWDYVYVDDVAKALCLISKKGVNGKRYSIASGIGRKLSEYIKDITEVTRNDILIKGIGKKAYSEKQVMYLCGDISELNYDTGFIPEISFREGINNAINEGG